MTGTFWNGSLSTVLLAAAILCVLIAAVCVIVRRRKKGGPCAGCPYAGSCGGDCEKGKRSE